MNTIRKASATTASALALLVGASAGVAQATDPTYFYNSDDSMQVNFSSGGGAIYATIIDRRNPDSATEVCQYEAVGTQGTPALPYYNQVFVTGPNPSAPMTIVFQQLGGHYSVTVTCQGTGNSANFSPVIY